VLLIVANDPWKKSPDREITPAQDRLAMVQALIRGDDGHPVAGLEVSDAEIRRGGPSYTITTLRELREAHPEAELFLIIGRDLVDDFPSWRQSSEIEALATIVVVDRPGYVTDAKRGWKLLVVPPVDVSSSELRDRLREGSDVSQQMTRGVIDEIRSRGLYGVRTSA
jgi:nicotinate-nucleotide adenylyltransferase